MKKQQQQLKQLFNDCQEILHDLPEVMAKDGHLWLQRLDKRFKKGQPVDRSLKQCHQSLTVQHRQWQKRLSNLPEANLNTNLPIYKHREELIKAIQNNQVIVVAGETGSGKTTQLPQLALLAGQGRTGIIGHTQPRRIAARSVATRIADELGEKTGKKIGYQVRFDNQFHQDGYIKLMTDGVLLNEFHDDPALHTYDTLIIDEAHERSLNIDFILGLIKNLLPKRPDLKVIITSATIDLERFSAYFDSAPVFQVTGRTYPVELRYRTNLEYQHAESFEELACEAVRELCKVGPGDILIFLPTEQAIRHLADHLRRHLPKVGEILPLYSRLSQAQQNRIFQTTSSRRIVLSTNIAETSLTVPGIRYVIDSGLARISRYSTYNKVQRLPIEAIAQASANQRMGRCGRLENGVCIRLYDEDDFNTRKEFIEPEILRTNLAAVILQMLVLDIGDVAEFDFIEPPEPKQINDGLQLLIELSAVTKQQQLTKLGKTLARLPLDPRLGRILIAAAKLNCLKEVVVLAAAIGLPDPRERPAESQQKADEYHQRFRDIRSDFVSLLKLWDYFNQLKEDLSWSQIRKRCQQEFIHFNRMREWREQVAQLKHLLKDYNYKLNDQPADYESIHKALLTGFITQVANHEKHNDYLAPRQTRVKIFPGSSLFTKQTKKSDNDAATKKGSVKWLVAGEIVQTSQNYARLVASIQPEWIEQLAGDLLKVQYSEPFWSKKAGRAMVRESALLYGLTIYSARNKPVAHTDPQLAKQWFIEQALIAREINTSCPELKLNWEVYDKALQMEEMGRVKGMLADRQWFINFYNKQLPDKVHNQPAFERWIKDLSKQAKDSFCLQLEDICQESLQNQTDDYPDTILLEDVPLKVDYVYKPGLDDDGIHIHLPVVLLSQIDAQSFEWLVPGFYEAKVIALIRGLPKQIRKNFVPVPDYAQAIMQRMTYAEGDLLVDMAKHMTQISGTIISSEMLADVELPTKLQPLLVVHDNEKEKPLFKSRDIEWLKQQCASEIKTSLGEVTTTTVYTEFPEKHIEPQVELTQGHTSISVYQALQPVKGGFQLSRSEHQTLAESWHRQSILALLIENNIKLNNEISGLFNNLHEINLRYALLPDWSGETTLPATKTLFDDFIIWQAKALLEEQGLCYNLSDFQALNAKLRATIVHSVDEIISPIEQLFSLVKDLRKIIDKPKDLRLLAIASEIKARLDTLVFKGFIHTVGETMLRSYPRYLKALLLRLDMAQDKPQRERQNQIIWDKYWSQFMALKSSQQTAELRMTMEEFHVSLFAQQLGTKIKVSEKRLIQLFADLE